MTFYAEYAMSRYGGIEYGVRGPASYTASTSESVTSADAEAPIASFKPAYTESVTGADGQSAIAFVTLAISGGVTGSDAIGIVAIPSIAYVESGNLGDGWSIVALFHDAASGTVMALDSYLGNFFDPATIFAVSPDSQSAVVLVEKRQSVSQADERANTVKSENRTFQS